MKRLSFILMVCFGLAILLGACGQQGASVSEDQSAATSQAGGMVRIGDSTGKSLDLPESPRIVCLYGSYSEAWLSAGGSLAGVTQEAVEERGLDTGAAEIVGTVKEPNAEKIIALEPDAVILSLDVAAQQDMVDVLESAGAPCLSYRVDTFEDYAAMMKEFCKATGRGDLYDEKVTEISKEIDAAREDYGFTENPPRVLLIRAFSTGMKAKSDEELAGAILKDLGCENIADSAPSMLEDLSLEEVIQADPDFLFVTTMGDEKKALDYLESLTAGNPAWSGLTAIQEGRFFVLPKELFHYKPNARWGESYRYLGRALHGQEPRDE